MRHKTRRLKGLRKYGTRRLPGASTVKYRDTSENKSIFLILFFTIFVYLLCSCFSLVTAIKMHPRSPRQSPARNSPDRAIPHPKKKAPKAHPDFNFSAWSSHYLSIQKTELTFNIVSGRLYGTIDGKEFSADGFSGGRGGTTTRGAAHPVVVNNPLLTHMKTPGHSPLYGGALPQGVYTLVPDFRKKIPWIRLEPAKGNVMYGRNSFAIHGSYSWGSEGCIVLARKNRVIYLRNLAATHFMAGQPIKLVVKATGDMDYQINRIREWDSIV